MRKKNDVARRYRGYRPMIEEIEGFVWDEANRERHYQKHGVDFPIVAKCDWSRVRKRKDTRHRANPPRWNALVALPESGLVLFVVYTKSDKVLNVISMRLADAEERAIFHA